MSRAGAVLFLSVLWVMACKHAEQAEHPRGESSEAKGVPHQPAGQKRAAARRDSDIKRPAAPGRPELTNNPAGLMKPEGPMRIQKRLADDGYYQGGELDTVTTEALRKFQGDHNLATTGAPDHQTVRALGLNPSDIWRAPEQRARDLKADPAP
jgi:hypothetical protein